MPRGGKRVGVVGTQYANRSDLRANAQPAAAGPSKQYGQQAAQLAAQQAIPLPTSAGPVSQAAPTQPLPGSFGALDRPTERPNEPVTAGNPLGPGPGPEVLGLPPQPMSSISAILNAAAASAPSSDLSALAEMAQALGQ